MSTRTTRRRNQKGRLPESIEAERAVLGAILLNEKAFEATSIMWPHDPRELFVVEAHALVYNAMKRIVQSGSQIDPVTLIGALQETNDFEQAGSLAYVSELSGCVPTSLNIGYYCQIVMSAYARRKLIMLARRIDALGMGCSDENDQILSVQELIRHAEWQLKAISEAVQVDAAAILDGNALAEIGIKDAERIASLNGQPAGIPTGLSVLDGFIHGFDRGDYIVLGAKPGTGKSAFAINAILAAARHDVPSLMFSCEMTPERIASRAFGILAGMHSHSLKQGFNVEKEMDAAREAAREIRTFKSMAVDPVMQLSVPRIRQKIKEHVDRYGTSLVVIDYIGRVKLGRRTESRRLEIEAISGEFQGMAKEFNTPILCLSQLNADAEFKESAGINENADISIKFETFDEKALEKTAQKFNITNPWVLDRIIGMRLTKNRNGPVGNKIIIFEKETQRFYPLDDRLRTQEPEPTYEEKQAELEDYQDGDCPF